jgi:uncharacterized membrane protein
MNGLDFFNLVLVDLRVILGLLMIFVIPGYAFTQVLYPSPEEIPLRVKLGLTFVLSIAITMISTLILDIILGIDTTGTNIFIILSIITVLAVLIQKLRENIKKIINLLKIDSFLMSIKTVFQKSLNSIIKKIHFRNN